MVYLEQAQTLSFDEARVKDAQILRGNVRFRHDSALMYCDSAYFYEQTNSLDAFGHVRFEQGDTLQGFGDVLYYDGNTKLARMRKHVRLIHGREKENPTVLTTDSLNYDRKENVAYYYTGGTIQDSLNTLTSVGGRYMPDTKQAVFSREVKLVNDKFTLTSDTLLYNTETKVTDMVSPTTIVYEEETTILTSLGWYNTHTEQSMLLDRSQVIHNDGKQMTGDTIYYDKAIGFGKAIGHIEMRDTVQQATLYGNYGEFWEEDSRGYATDSALMVDWSDAEHYSYIHADTLFTEELHYTDSTMTDSTMLDSTYHRVRAYYGVRVYRDDMQMVCDSMVYLDSDSTIHLYTDPVCWNENLQISADSITIFIHNGTVERAEGIGKALNVMQDTATLLFNQMSGKEITAYLEDGEVKLVDMSGNALTIYYPVEDDGDIIGMNTTESSYIRIYVEDQKIRRLRFTKETTGILYPMDQIPGGSDRLASFFWAEEVRPLNPQDVFRHAVLKKE
jgi:lipopolysaccharide export system protein LptA